MKEDVNAKAISGKKTWGFILSKQYYDGDDDDDRWMCFGSRNGSWQIIDWFVCLLSNSIIILFIMCFFYIFAALSLLSTIYTGTNYRIFFFAFK